VERVVLNALAKETRLCRLISAPSANNLRIVFGEADPPLGWLKVGLRLTSFAAKIFHEFSLLLP
jgi:hypothetical protein